MGQRKGKKEALNPYVSSWYTHLDPGAGKLFCDLLFKCSPNWKGEIKFCPVWIRTTSFEDQQQWRPPSPPLKILEHSMLKIWFRVLLRHVLNILAGLLCRDADATWSKTTQAVRLWWHINLNKDILQVWLNIKPIARALVGGGDYAVATLFNISSRLWLTTSSWVC